MRRAGAPREIKEFETGDKCVLLGRFDVHSSGQASLWLRKGTVVEIVGHYYGNLFEIMVEHGGGYCPATSLRKLCPLELLALEADPSLEEGEPA